VDRRIQDPHWDDVDRIIQNPPEMMWTVYYRTPSDDVDRRIQGPMEWCEHENTAHTRHSSVEREAYPPAIIFTLLPGSVYNKWDPPQCKHSMGEYDTNPTLCMRKGALHIYCITKVASRSLSVCVCD
jgi:hypothetical protein